MRRALLIAAAITFAPLSAQAASNAQANSNTLLGSGDGQMWVRGPDSPGRDPMTRPAALGFMAALDHLRRMN